MKKIIIYLPLLLSSSAYAYHYPSGEIFLDVNKSFVTYCKPYKIKFVNASSYISHENWLVNKYDYLKTVEDVSRASVVKFEPNAPSQYCDGNRITTKDNKPIIGGSEEVKFNDKVKIIFENPSYSEFKYLNIDDNSFFITKKWYYLDNQARPITLLDFETSIALASTLDHSLFLAYYGKPFNFNPNLKVVELVPVTLE